MHTTIDMNCIAIGPWYVCRKLTACMADGKTHLANTGQGWVTRTGPVAPWSGRHTEAVRLAATHGGDPVPTKWVDIRHLRRDWREKETIKPNGKLCDVAADNQKDKNETSGSK